MSEDLNVVGHVAAGYSAHPIIKALVQLVPGGGCLDTLIEHRATEIHKNRLRIFFDELASGELAFTQEIITNEDFLHCYFCTVKAALNARRKEKIQLFARLLSSRARVDSLADTDDYEEVLNALDSITLRQFEVLSCLRDFETEYSGRHAGNALERIGSYWDFFKKDVFSRASLTTSEFDSFMVRLEATGLYIRILGTYLGNQGIMGKTTRLFHKLQSYVKRDTNRVL